MIATGHENLPCWKKGHLVGPASHRHIPNECPDSGIRVIYFRTTKGNWQLAASIRTETRITTGSENLPGRQEDQTLRGGPVIASPNPSIMHCSSQRPRFRRRIEDLRRVQGW